MKNENSMQMRIGRIVTLTAFLILLVFFGTTNADADDPVHEHVTATRRENEIAATCERAGSYELVEYCSECGDEISREPKTEKKLGHNKVNVARVAPTCEENGCRKHFECTRCGKWYHRNDKTQEVTPESQALLAKDHAWGEGVISKSPTCTDVGVRHYTCSNDNSHQKDEDIAALDHKWDTGSVTKDPTCRELGIRTYKCERDSKHTMTEEIEKIPHTPDNPVEENREEAGCEESGSYDEVTYCKICEVEIARKQKSISPKGHSTQKNEGTEADCEFEGIKQHWQCTKCDKLFMDGKGLWDVAESELILPPKGHMWSESSLAKNPTCTVDGNKEYWKCGECGKYYGDREGKRLIDFADIVIGKLGHSWGSPSYLWDDDNEKVTAVIACDNGNAPHFEKEVATTASKQISEATCISKGSTKYTAVFSNNLFSAQTKIVYDIPIDVGAHSYGDPVYVWSADKSTVTATVRCKNDPFHTHSETASVTREIIDAPTCTQKGSSLYTAEFSDNIFDKLTSEEIIPSAGHKWNSGVITKMPDTMTEGVKTYTCISCGEQKDESVAALTSGGLLLPKMTAKGKKSLCITWNGMEHADGYDVFMGMGKKTSTMSIAETITDNSSQAIKWTAKNLRAKTCYTAQVKAFVILEGSKIYVNEGPVIKAFTSGGSKKYTNPKSIKLKKKTKSLKVGKSFKIKAKVRKPKNKSKLKLPPQIEKLRYQSSDTAVATVTKTGRVRASSKGSCRIYVYAANGIMKSVKINVR